MSGLRPKSGRQGRHHWPGQRALGGRQAYTTAGMDVCSETL